MKSKLAIVVALSCISILTNGCSLVRQALGTEPAEEPACVGPEFDVWGTREVLGPAEPFDNEARRAAMGTEPTTLDSIADIAGWQGNWDRVIDVSDNTEAEELDEFAGTTSTVCWKNIKGRDVGTNDSSEGVLLFMDGGTPVQVQWYKGSEKILETGESPVVQRTTPLIPDRGELVPEK